MLLFHSMLVSERLRLFDIKIIPIQNIYPTMYIGWYGFMFVWTNTIKKKKKNLNRMENEIENGGGGGKNEISKVVKKFYESSFLEDLSLFMIKFISGGERYLSAHT